MSRSRGAATMRYAFVWVAALAFACGGAPVAEVPDDTFDQTELGVQDTRCDFRGRKDRVALLTQGRGAKAPNVRRVYAVGTHEGKRVLRCREVDTNLDGKKDLVRTFDERGRPELEQADSDYDGRIDTWVSFAGSLVVRVEVDRNRDGKPDEFRTYSGGQLARVQRDTTFDGEVDAWEVYEAGRLRRIGMDRDGDQRVDVWYRDATKAEAETATPQSPEPALEAGQDVAGRVEEPAPDGAE